MNEYGIPPPLLLPTSSVTKVSPTPPRPPAFSGAPLHPGPLDLDADMAWGSIPAFPNHLKGAGSEAQGCVEEARSRWRNGPSEAGVEAVFPPPSQASWQYSA